MSRILELKHVTGGYGGVDIIHDIDLHVDSGEIVVIIGPNGAGKSTAIKAVFGLLHLSAGRVALDGRDITNMPTAQVVRLGVCYVPQLANVFPSLTVAENLEMGAFARHDDYRPRLDQVYELLPTLKEKRRQAAGTLSGGQRQMVAIGKALMLEPRILLLDEPTAGLSPRFQMDILDIVKQINAAGTPVLMVEQNAKQSLSISSRGYVFVDGRKRMEDTGEGLLANPEIAEMFLGG